MGVYFRLVNETKRQYLDGADKIGEWAFGDMSHAITLLLYGPWGGDRLRFVPDEHGCGYEAGDCNERNCLYFAVEGPGWRNMTEKARALLRDCKANGMKSEHWHTWSGPQT